MAFSDELDQRLVPLVKELDAKGFERFTAGEVSLDAYKEFLCQTYQFAKHVPRFFGLALSRMDVDRVREVRWFYEHGDGEIGHHFWALNDLKELGVSRDEADLHAPNAGNYALIAGSYYEAGAGNPLAVMGSSWAIEGLIAHRYANFAENIKAKLGVSDRAVSFVALHAKADEGHAPENARFLDQIAKDPADREAIARFAEKTLVYFAMYFEGILADTANGFQTHMTAEPSLSR